MTEIYEKEYKNSIQNLLKEQNEHFWSKGIFDLDSKIISQKLKNNLNKDNTLTNLKGQLTEISKHIELIESFNSGKDYLHYYLNNHNKLSSYIQKTVLNHSLIELIKMTNAYVNANSKLFFIDWDDKMNLMITTSNVLTEKNINLNKFLPIRHFSIEEFLNIDIDSIYLADNDYKNILEKFFNVSDELEELHNQKESLVNPNTWDKRDYKKHLSKYKKDKKYAEIFDNSVLEIEHKRILIEVLFEDKSDFLKNEFSYQKIFLECLNNDRQNMKTLQRKILDIKNNGVT